MRHVLAWVLVAVAIAWGTAIAAAPLVRSSTDGGPRFSVAKMVPISLAALTYVAGAFVCHQRPERSFHLAGAQLPVCARCAALYWGGAAGLAVWVIARSRRAGQRRDASRGALTSAGRFARAIFIFGLPIAVTLTLSALGIWDAGNTFRAISSAPFGVTLGALLAAVVLGDVAET